MGLFDILTVVTLTLAIGLAADYLAKRFVYDTELFQDAARRIARADAYRELEGGEVAGRRGTVSSLTTSRASCRLPAGPTLTSILGHLPPAARRLPSRRAQSRRRRRSCRAAPSRRAAPRSCSRWRAR
jgi:hypothetical protein